MTQEIIMPKLGLTMTHGTVTKWLKKEGDAVEAGEAVVVIETDKISSEVESPVSGTILRILAGEGEDREITAPLCIVGDRSRIFITPVARLLALQNGLDYKALAGSGPEGRIVKKDVLKALEGSVRELAGAGGSGRILEHSSVSGSANAGSGGQGAANAGSEVQGAANAGSSVQDVHEVRITPLARRIAQENGIDYRSIKGTGPEGRIVKEDVEAYIAAQQQAVPQQAGPQPSSAKDLAGRAVYKRVPLSGIRKIIAQRLTQSKHDIPHTYFKITIDAGNLMDMKGRLAGAVNAKAGRKLTLNDLLLKAVASVLAEFPDMNVSLADNELVYIGDINLGIAVDSGKGLVVPVLGNADRLDLSSLCRKSGDLVDRARAGKLELGDLSGGTFTVSNLGAYGIDEFTAIINPPESAILAVGKATEAPCARGGEVVIRPLMHLTLSVDHRVIDGALAARFMKRLKDVLEEPYAMLV